MTRSTQTVCLALFWLAAAVTSQTQNLMTDPIFGISYDPRRVRFEEAPAKISSACPQIRNERAWVYARLRTQGVEYLIVSGLTRICPDGPGSCEVAPDVTGVIVALRGSGCSVEAADGFYWRKNDPLWELPPTALESMARDAVHRYAKAFGGKKNFLDNLTPRTREHLEPVMRKQLEVFEREPGD